MNIMIPQRCRLDKHSGVLVLYVTVTLIEVRVIAANVGARGDHDDTGDKHSSVFCRMVS